MKIGAYLVKRCPYSFEDQLKITVAAGFDSVCLSAKKVTDGTGATPELCEKLGIEVENVHLTGDKTSTIWNEGETGDAVVKRYCREIQYYAERGIKVGVAHTTWGRTTPVDSPSKIGYDRFDRIAETAAKYDFTLAVENSAFPGHVHAVFNHFPDNKNIGHCHDCGHRNAFARHVDFLGLYGDRLVATHIHDNDGSRDLHMMPFDGTIDWEWQAEALAKTEFARNRITAEFGGARRHEFPGMTAEELHKEFDKLAVSSDPDIFRIGDGYVSIYENLTYEEVMARLYEKMRKLADMIERKTTK